MLALHSQALYGGSLQELVSMLPERTRPLMANDGNLTIEGAEILFRNFSGKEGPYNREGDRNFCLIIPDDLIRPMEQDGWNIKELRAYEEGDLPRKYVQVSVSYKRRPPTMVMITNRGRTNITEEEDCELFDWVDIKNVDLIIHPYNWAVNGKTGLKAYLRSLYITIDEDALAIKYQNVPEIGAADQPLQIESGARRPYDFEGEVVD